MSKARDNVEILRDGGAGAGVQAVLQGEATVAEINALVADPNPSDAYIMLDAGTITYGLQDFPVAIADWIVWGDLGYFTNVGNLDGPKGDDGGTGPQGPQGNQGIQGVKGDTGDTGDTGAKGDTGDTGAGFYFQGDATVAELNALISNPTEGFSWSMLDAGTITYGTTSVVVAIGDVVAWGATDTSFANLGSVEGPEGAQGIQGIQGEQGIQGIQGEPGDLTDAPTDSNTYARNDGVWIEVPKTAQENSTGELIKNIVKVTQAEYDVLTPIGTSMYLIVG